MAEENDKRTEAARKGGKAAQEQRTPEERSEIGRMGGEAAQANRTPEERSEIGRMGGTAPHHSPRGFAAMDPEKQKEIASQGGKAAHERGTAHEFTSEEAREAGKKGGQSRGKEPSEGNA
jgi:general stress protein YciG